tara:strand:- start:2751 stop:3308 length:558 start_codon:yes stop_codon:yes gene_type:complete
MRFLNLILIIFLSLTISIKAESNQNIIDELEKGGKLIFIRHAYAPGNGDPENFNLNDCLTQRNLSERGRMQARKIGAFIKKNQIPIDKILSSEWCRCKETSSLAFGEYETKNFLNSFYSIKFSKNKDSQISELKRYINKWNSDKNLILITHYVMIAEILDYASTSGEMIISDRQFNKIGNIKIKY